MEFFQSPNIDWISKKWKFIVVSILLSTVGIVSLIAKGGPRYGVDFRGGTVVEVKFRETPPLDRIRGALDAQGLRGITLQQFGDAANNEILISLDLSAESEADLDTGRQAILRALGQEFGAGERPSWHEAGVSSLTDHLVAAGVAAEQAQTVAAGVIAFRDAPPRSGLINSFEDLNQVQGVTPQVIQAFQDGYSLPDFAVRNVELVGPKVGATLRRQALLATLLGLGSMLAYIAFRFEWIFGLAAVIAVLHDVVITVGFLSLFDREISLTIIASLLTLVGFSVNDTIVVFDRIRENVRFMRRENFSVVANLSINQTLSRTVLTSGLAFLTVLSLFLFGGEVLNGFAFTLVVGILIGTYSSIAVASPLVVSWQEYAQRDRRGGAAARAAREQGKAKREKVKVAAKA
jgi:preprotein translocase subunit SecF